MGSNVPPDAGFHFGYLVAFASYIFFTLNMRYLLPLVLPPEIESGLPQKIWKWKNTANSLLHSAITGYGSLYCFWVTPKLGEDLIGASTAASVAVTSVAVGYFIYDFFDLAVNNYSRSRPLLLHHFLVTICFGLAMVTRKYQGYAMVALLVEINSIFLHIRQLLILHGVSKQDTFYRANSFVNLGTFLIFRLLTLIYQGNWLYVHQAEVPRNVVVLGFLTNAVIMVLSIILLVQILKKDFFSKELKCNSE